MKDQVCSLELAKRLKELGVKQDGYWNWVLNKGRHPSEDRTYLLENERSYNFRAENRCWCAFTVAEMGEMLKAHRPFDHGFSFEWNEVWKKWEVFLLDPNNDQEHREDEVSEAESRGKMLIYLIEKELRKPR